MLDIRTLLLGAPEDHYQPVPAIREAERAVYPVLRRPAPPAPLPSGPRQVHAGEVIAR